MRRRVTFDGRWIKVLLHEKVRPALSDKVVGARTENQAVSAQKGILRMRFALLLASVAAAAAIGLSPAHARDGCGRGWFFNGVACALEDVPYDQGEYRSRYDDAPYVYREPPCEPGKHRVIVNGNSQCRYPGEPLGSRSRRSRSEPSCEPGKHRVVVNGNSQCRYPGEAVGGSSGRSSNRSTNRSSNNRRSHGGEPPCEPGKHRVMINGNSQCR